uniref:Uncharacterized protein n=1 Tax=Glossina palpalis gambiensis TaxID=67801 RepID=A0A1B0BAD6_9MUSC
MNETTGETNAVETLENTDTSTTVPYEDNTDGPDAYLWLLVFSVLKSWLLESFKLTTFQVNCFSVLASVLVMSNAIITLTPSLEFALQSNVLESCDNPVDYIDDWAYDLKIVTKYHHLAVPPIISVVN